MGFQASLQALADVTGATIEAADADSRSISARGISTDTRSLRPQDVFLALKGDRFDGHRFAQQALDQGVAAVIVQEPIGRGPQLIVEDTLAAYQAIAQWWRQTLETPLVGITGSVGKTTTKELIAAALSTQATPVLKTQANYNNEIGVPQTLLELDETHRYGVIEMGMRGPGQIALLAKIAQPEVAVITNVGTAHIELLGSRQAIANAKCELLAELSPSGTAVLNADDERLMQTAAGVWSGKHITFGLESGDIRGQLVDPDTIEVNGISLPLPLPGKHNAMNFLAAIAVMEAFELNWRDWQTGLVVNLPSGRSTRVVLPHDIVLLDETYNAGLESMKAALQLLKDTPGQRHIAVLGTMKELGEHAVSLHRQVGETVQALQIDRLLTLADPTETDALIAGAASVPVESFNSPRALQDRLQQLIQPGDRILFKASRAVLLDKVVDALRDHLSSTPV
ncbi:UDP-N-acetylmuramoyl-tripeptide--D-alanyl-D-alanine ligase [Oscillatoria sp. CS-180]|uniref:UDP-N-acetylmuramoyl-tripeptide--D-alanyl-D- alanine ligase n=1 Tax=Oscillatoria sp. CS-180 TaxID=3021720 RepID=UPI00232E5BF6|nr:UDP-N-acetylmuramoyl-tripeptide--D-alanyl-D-alanine ligase [Oscillatoria sp. CS-180]MDB9529389.1 UDP-N-acetylmuramoyl-tripeptide--D-alanyl-D-alanine ligase [Oscillatoria sp. CS-180]